MHHRAQSLRELLRSANTLEDSVHVILEEFLTKFKGAIQYWFLSLALPWSFRDGHSNIMDKFLNRTNILAIKPTTCLSYIYLL